jgi:hypothetical protein
MMSDSIRSRAGRPLLVSLAAYLVLLIVTGGILEEIEDPPLTLTVVLSLLPPAAAAVGMYLQRSRIREEDGLERTVYSESAAIAFLVTMLSALSYGFLQESTDAPSLSGFVVWSFGMGMWALASMVMNRRLR